MIKLETIVSEHTTPSPVRVIPVTILSGFLGAGKTTLLQYILSVHHGKRIAIIENEFGEEIGVESLVAKNGLDGEILDGFYELSNGCICCSIRNDLVNTLEKLVERRDRFDYILVETTGMADPGKVASLFWMDNELEGRIVLDGIVTLVDARRILYHLTRLETQVEAEAQLAYADRILLNKRDLVDDEETRLEIEERIQRINGIASLKWTERSRVDLDEILNIQSFTTNRAKQVEAELQMLRQKNKNKDERDYDECKDEQSSVSTHTGGMQTTCVRIKDGALNQDKLERWLGELLWDEEVGGKTEPGCDVATRQKIFRVKGVLAIAGEPYKFILQAVHELFEVYPSEERWPQSELNGTETCVTQVVFIGLHLRKNELQAGLQRCLMSER
ncbi:unnamed protein product [Peronospora belbahrii]|uniref:CobW C-terminal domain-containing protein n=1 Tax=Peronospora belbahrii TaxID=622444 RepID=A0ABN8CWZ4_9STRA|nr:unnamed protein product [Peronospora belbahrii]